MFLVSGKTCEAGSSVDGAGKQEFKCVSGRAGMLGVLLLLKYSGSVRQRDDREGAKIRFLLCLQKKSRSRMSEKPLQFSEFPAGAAGRPLSSSSGRVEQGTSSTPLPPRSTCSTSGHQYESPLGPAMARSVRANEESSGKATTPNTAVPICLGPSA